MAVREAEVSRPNDVQIIPTTTVNLLYDKDKKICKCVVVFRDPNNHETKKYSCVKSINLTRQDFIDLEISLEEIMRFRPPTLDVILNMLKTGGLDVKENPDAELIENVNLPNFLYLYKEVITLVEEKKNNIVNEQQTEM